MTKISNENAYPKVSQPSIDSIVIGTDKSTTAKRTRNFALGDILSMFISGLAPEVGGTLKTTLIEYDGVLENIEDIVNNFTPAIEVLSYENLFVKANGVVFLYKKHNISVGVGETPVESSDFIEFPVSVGPQGPAGNGIASIVLTSTVGLVKTYTITYTNSSTFTFTITDGSNGTNGTNGSVWRNGSGVPSNSLGVNGDYYLNTANGDVYLKASGTYSVVANIKGADGDSIQIEESATTLVNGDGSVDTPYQIEVKNLQKVITANVTLANTDNLHTIFVNNSGPLTITVPSTLANNFCIAVVQLGTADVTFAQGSGATISSAVGNKIKGQYYSVILEKIEDTAVYILSNATKA
jgi:hypothetical protein